tara:strand:- start:2335 stop:2646 length:312 start_codon:yes stop_codon:yes gene_type:complete
MFPKGMGGMMKKAQQMQKEMAKIQKEIEELEVEGQSGGGLISVLVNGKKKIMSIDIKSDALKEDKEILEDLILSAINQALDSIDKISKEKMGPLTGGLNIPGM